ncbi:lipocalin-like domain-containing protein [Methylosarcina fibrata]|uniref:lipocalin-like domain-containing protein n=1 Tax=Methylosarcina fibrata TaxID=105972 RepID=UPI0003722E42|nr:lipocalin-like domain-containing protein [Methylosarcina fibrata]
MNVNRIALGFAVLIGMLAAASILWHTLFPFGIEPVADRSFGETAAQKDESLSDLLSNDEAHFERALKPRPFVFPKDHGAHDAFRSEWWYFTGNLDGADGRPFGYELTFFRFALSDKVRTSPSAWRTRQLYMAHLTLTDVQAKRFHTDERFSRAANGLAGAEPDPYHVWLYDWSAQAEGPAEFPLRLRAESDRFAVDLLLDSQKGPVLQGEDGLSRKSGEPGNASYYYSYTRLTTRGSLRITDKDYPVTGNSWMDREWSTSALSKEQSGWDWFALQFSDNSELMFYRLRRKDGRPDEFSAGSLVRADGSKVMLKKRDVIIEETGQWQSPGTKIRYPSGWRLRIPGRQLAVEIVPLIDDQELNVSVRYWEGAVRIAGTKEGLPVSGRGYVELAGYR